MAKLPQIQRIRREDIPDAPAWIEKLLSPLNLFMEGTYQALNRGLTFGENVAANIVDIDFTTPSGYATPIVFARYSSNAGTSYSSSETVVNFEDKEIDTHNAVATGAGTWKFTAPMASYYSSQATMVFAYAAYTTSQAVYISSFVNGAKKSLLDYERADAAVTNFRCISGGDIVYLNAGDTYQIKVFNGRGSTATNANAWDNYVSILSSGGYGQAVDNFGSTVKFQNPLKTKPKGVAILYLVEKDDINAPIYEATGLSWRINAAGEVEISYIPGLKSGTAYSARLLVA